MPKKDKLAGRGRTVTEAKNALSVGKMAAEHARKGNPIRAKMLGAAAKHLGSSAREYAKKARSRGKK